MPVKTLDLNGHWKLIDAEHGKGRAKRLSSPERKTSKWLTTEVPGDIHPTLRAAGRIPDPFMGLNVRKCTWTGHREWWHRRDFKVPKSFKGDRIELVFDGIDTYGTVYVNGVKVGETSNMFLRYRFDVTEHVRPGEVNTVVVCVGATIPIIEARDTSKYFACFYTPRIFARKAQCQFSWDWAPHLPALGIWRGVRLEAISKGVIEEVYIQPRMTGELFIRVKVDETTHVHSLDLKRNRDAKGAPEHLKLVFEVKDGAKTIRQTARVVGPSNFMNVKVPKPKLWWPNGYGEPHLYDYVLKLMEGDKVLHAKTGRFGIRQVELVEDIEGADKRTFRFRINGRDVFCLGANWVPADCFPGTVKRERYEHLIRLAREANFNMLRLWGGGIYETDTFYDLCDENGIMIWQDLMFACSDIPDDDAEWTMSVVPELEYQVKRLRNHPCVVYWCGGNEKTGAYGRLKTYGEIMTNYLAAGVVRDLAPDMAYHNSSPFSYATVGNDPNSGDTHTGSWEQAFEDNIAKFRDYITRKEVAFASEFGMHGPCLMRSIRKFIPQDKLWPINEVWDEHAQDNPYNSLDETYIQVHEQAAATLFGKPESAAEFVKFASTVHAELEREEFEHHRRRQFDNGGSMVWMFNDTWPCVTWALVDYYGLAKPVYYHLKRACAPVLVSFRKAGRGYDFFVTTRRNRPLEGVLRIEAHFVDGTTKKLLKKRKVRLGANDSQLIANIPGSAVPKDNGAYLCAVLEYDGRAVRATCFPRLWKKVPWPEPGLRMRVGKLARKEGEYQVTVTLSTKKYARCVNIATAEDMTAYFSDNFFDMVPGETRRVTISAPEKFDPKGLKLNHWLTTWD